MSQSAYQLLLNAHLRDLNPITAGWDCRVTAGDFQIARTYTILHYVVSGNGTLTIGNDAWQVKPGQAFLLVPGDGTAQFRSQPGTVVDYRWVSFTGTMSHCFAQLPRVFDVPEDLLGSVRKLGHDNPCSAYELAADLLLLRARMIPEKPQACDYAAYVMDYVQNTYTEPITVASIAQMMALDRSYLSRLFKKKTGMTLHNYINMVRVQEAKRLMMEDYNISQAAAMCGFADVFIFSKIFSQINGMSPTQWRKIVLLNIATRKNNFCKEE